MDNHPNIYPLSSFHLDALEQADRLQTSVYSDKSHKSLWARLLLSIGCDKPSHKRRVSVCRGFAGLTSLYCRQYKEVVVL